MDVSLAQSSRMENGEAGIIAPASTSFSEKTPHELSPRSTSSSKTLVGRPTHHRKAPESSVVKY